jgi:hypothetical protein
MPPRPGTTAHPAVPGPSCIPRSPWQCRIKPVGRTGRSHPVARSGLRPTRRWRSSGLGERRAAWPLAGRMTIEAIVSEGRAGAMRQRIDAERPDRYVRQRRLPLLARTSMPSTATPAMKRGKPPGSDVGGWEKPTGARCVTLSMSFLITLSIAEIPSCPWMSGIDDLVHSLKRCPSSWTGLALQGAEPLRRPSRNPCLRVPCSSIRCGSQEYDVTRRRSDRRRTLARSPGWASLHSRIPAHPVQGYGHEHRLAPIRTGRSPGHFARCRRRCARER